MKLTKNKIKSFFKFDIEKDLQEEECTTVFEKVNLFILTKNKLFLGILLFLLIINILVGFDINYFYIRAILSFIFLITIPGLLIMLMMKIREVGFWEYLVYTIGLSISFIMFGGLAVNWILPWLNITDKPLSLYPILICFNIFLIVFWLIAYIRNKDLKPFDMTMPKLDWINRIFFITPMLFPFLSVLGAFLLNNHGTNILTMIMLGGIAVYVFLVVIFRKKLNKNVFPWAILIISISLLFMWWLRSWFVSGVDINLEYHIFQLTKDNAFWSISNFKNTYNAMLSVTIFPTILSLFVKINDHYILKIFTPLIFSIVPLGVYLFLKRYAKNILVFVAVFFFVSQPSFLKGGGNIPFRQVIALLFFALTLLILFNKNINFRLKKTLFFIFCFSMIVSHYSTTYVAFGFFIFAYVICTAFKKIEDKKPFFKIYKKLNLKLKND